MKHAPMQTPTDLTPHGRRPGAWLCCTLIASLAASLTGCAAPQPWEKGTLARPEMKMDKDGLEARFMSHVYFSKEAAAGGDGVGGGGCGCN
jgi:hypothetical protein